MQATDRPNATPMPGAAVPAEEPEGGLSRFTNWALGIYLAAVLGLMLILRITPNIDIVIVLLAIAAILLGRTKQFIRDWGPFVVFFLAWEAMSGVANQFGQRVQSDSVIGLERALFAGHVPTVSLQAWLYHPGHIGPLDVVLTLVYVSHFFFPVAAAYLFWAVDRRLYYRFVITLMLVGFAGFITYLIIPVAPPRFAGLYGQSLPVVDISGEVLAQFQWTLSWVYQHIVGNPVAAFPSLHAAFPLLVFLFLRERWPRAAWLWFPVMITIWFAVVYLGHHYVVDVIGGILYAAAGYLAARDPRIVRFASGIATRIGRAWRRLWAPVRRSLGPNLGQLRPVNLGCGLVDPHGEQGHVVDEQARQRQNRGACRRQQGISPADQQRRHARRSHHHRVQGQ